MDTSDPRLTHVDESGVARMVDVTGKDVTARVAVASGRVLVSGEVVRLPPAGEGVVIDQQQDGGILWAEARWYSR